MATGSSPKSRVESYSSGGDYLMAPGQRYAYGRSAVKKKWAAIHNVRGRDIKSTMYTGTGRKMDAVEQTLKGSMQRRDIAKQLRALHGMSDDQFARQTSGYGGSSNPQVGIVKAHRAAMAAKGVRHRPAGSPSGGQFY